MRARARSSRRDGWLTDANGNSDENGICFYFESVRSFVRSVVRPSVDRVRGSVRSVDRAIDRVLPAAAGEECARDSLLEVDIQICGFIPNETMII